MKDTNNEAAGSDIGLHGQEPALHVICLGNSGGPSEENVTAFLVRSIGSEWAKGSLLAVDAGSHLAPITRILEQSFPSISGDRSKAGRGSNGSHASNGDGISLPGRLERASLSPSPAVPEDNPPKPEPTILSEGPFAGLKFPNDSARANALHVLRTYIATYLITHPHLDHLSGFAINTAAFHATSRPKTLAALPSTVNAIKDHIFNDVIWPNLTDEDGGVGFVTFQRLKEGGDVMIGEGEGRGYIDVCDGLSARAFKVSHGTCTKGPPSHHHRGSIPGIPDGSPPYNGSIAGTLQDLGSTAMNRTTSFPHLQSGPPTPGVSSRQSFFNSHPSPAVQATDQHRACVVDSTAFFLRDEYTQREVLIFGDVEPDSISLTPRNHIIWQEAARKIAHGVLGGIFIECSYDDSQVDALLFGHLNPKHLIAELQYLGRQVNEAKSIREAERNTKKRKRSGPNGLDNIAKNVFPENDHRKRSRSLANRTVFADDRRRSSAPDNSTTSAPTDATNRYHPQLDHDMISPQNTSFPRPDSVVDNSTGSTAHHEMPLSGIKILIIHIKDTLKDGPHVSETILTQLKDYEAQLQEEGQGLGCEFVISQSGESYVF
ncbi:3',5'-cyclic-nucleotide phosphodiesterase 1 [Fulvia fulva]|uniref:3',5'-cyclic-nucleotide phosphodiesterase 1 n=1 Tax=Passalora fulva TaxID=5499 RepID=A0A9Q8P5Z9_PASFU|nr:3',5'-cyclic-nucleotide phosphodiesterase 1 [Fulvia fulva]KAK4631472.1 3',5'-cyclic-nucleotide phosphodiesterase 1 [Fulvia fulva]KAK4633716.1 3',5'-cyclic-nucleotide phosphodiesterase 1 [Fulvia fulva]UJO14625.1 3',5'-cyclic-nucleotide phosphodiesterase 1 [Fulvia fulva]WPV11472.1 3',5'-cyclic-nucleotide phosphodiesterase 1 [Fulvia fulva]WPV25776.1 3',5'-cyclic-nucleotide phosphodiesterase 1 [Fulvia fulva]